MAETSTPNDAFAEPIDVGAQSLAAEYAKALFAAAEKSGALDKVVDELNEIVTAILKHPKLADVIASSMFSSEHKVQMIDRAFGKRAHPLVTNFLKVLATHQRSYIVRPIMQEIQKLYNKARGRIPVRVVTAAAISDTQKKSVAA